MNQKLNPNQIERLGKAMQFTRSQRRRLIWLHITLQTAREVLSDLLHSGTRDVPEIEELYLEVVREFEDRLLEVEDAVRDFLILGRRD